MKKLVISALLVLVGSCLFTSCSNKDTTVPRDTNARTTSTYSK
jgi:hypothetical protein